MEVFVIIFISLLVLAIYSSIRQMRNFDFTPIEPIDWEWHKTESPIERRLLQALRNSGYSPRTQVPCGKYRIDIAFPVQRIAIECDGKAYHSTPKQKAHDRRKNSYLNKNGWKVLRFSGSAIHRDIKGCLKRIEREIEKRQLT